jgi:hypothetical protein
MTGTGIPHVRLSWLTSLACCLGLSAIVWSATAARAAHTCGLAGRQLMLRIGG